MKLIAAIVIFFVLSRGNLCRGDDWEIVERILQRSGEKAPGSLLMRYPRSDLNVSMEGVILDPAMGMTSRILFVRRGKGTVLSGELKILPKEVGVVMKKLVAEGLTVLGLHPTPHETFTDLLTLHFGGEGDPQSLVWAFTPALSATGTPTGPPKKVLKPVRSGWNDVEKIIGAGKSTGNSLVIRIPRPQVIERYPELRLEAEAEVVFQKIGGRTAVYARIPVFQEDIYRVSRILVGSGICIRAINGQSLFPSPRLVILDLWGTGADRIKLARKIKQATDAFSPLR